MIGSFIELTTKKDSMNNNLDRLNEDKGVMVIQMSVPEEQMMVLDTEKLR